MFHCLFITINNVRDLLLIIGFDYDTSAVTFGPEILPLKIELSVVITSIYYLLQITDLSLILLILGSLHPYGRCTSWSKCQRRRGP